MSAITLTIAVAIANGAYFNFGFIINPSLLLIISYFDIDRLIFMLSTKKRPDVLIRLSLHFYYFNKLSPVISLGIGNPNNCKIVGAKSPNFPPSFNSKCVFVRIKGTGFVV